MRTPLRARGFVAFAIISFTSTAARAQDMPGMTMPAAPLGIAMERQGSGTTWTPDAIVLPSKHFAAGEWSMMVHGFGFLQQIKQGGDRGAEQFGSLNWAMLMATRDVSGGRFQLRTISAPPAVG